MLKIYRPKNLRRLLKKQTSCNFLFFQRKQLFFSEKSSENRGAREQKSRLSRTYLYIIMYKNSTVKFSVWTDAESFFRDREILIPEKWRIWKICITFEAEYARRRAVPFRKNLSNIFHDDICALCFRRKKRMLRLNPNTLRSRSGTLPSGFSFRCGRCWCWLPAARGGSFMPSPKDTSGICPP